MQVCSVALREHSRRAMHPEYADKRSVATWPSAPVEQYKHYCSYSQNNTSSFWMSLGKPDIIPLMLLQSP